MHESWFTCKQNCPHFIYEDPNGPLGKPASFSCPHISTCRVLHQTCSMARGFNLGAKETQQFGKLEVSKQSLNSTGIYLKHKYHLNSKRIGCPQITLAPLNRKINFYLHTLQFKLKILQNSTCSNGKWARKSQEQQQKHEIEKTPLKHLSTYFSRNQQRYLGMKNNYIKQQR